MRCRPLLAGLLAGWMLAAAGWGQVGETLVRLQDPAAGKFPSGKLLLASDGFFYGTTEIGGKPGSLFLVTHRLLHSPNCPSLAP